MYLAHRANWGHLLLLKLKRRYEFKLKPTYEAKLIRKMRLERYPYWLLKRIENCSKATFTSHLLKL